MKKLIAAILFAIVGFLVLCAIGAACGSAPATDATIQQACEACVGGMEANANRVYTRDETAVMLLGCMNREQNKVGPVMDWVEEELAKLEMYGAQDWPRNAAGTLLCPCGKPGVMFPQEGVAFIDGRLCGILGGYCSEDCMAHGPAPAAVVHKESMF